MSFAFRRMLHNVTCYDRGWDTKTKGRGYGTWYDRHILRQLIRSRRAGAVVLGEEGQCLPAYRDRSTDAVHAISSTLNGPVSSHNSLNLRALCE